MKKRMTRREFMALGSSTVLGTGLFLSAGFKHGVALPQESRVVEVTHPNAVLDKRQVDKRVVKKMLREGINTLTGKKQPWAQFFTPNDRIGLKINTLGRPLLFTHHELIQSLIEELRDFGVKENNIIVWDRWEHHMLDCKFTLNTSDEGVRCYGTENGRDRTVQRIDPDVVYQSEFDDPDERENGTVCKFSSVFTRDCDKVINLAILKDHVCSGVTLCLKNIAYGVCNNNNRFHRPEFIGPFISDICAQPHVKKKFAFHIIDGLEGCYDRGPDPDSSRVLFAPKTLWLGRDPVALDAVGFRVIEEKRREKGLSSLKESQGFYEGGRPVDHIELASKKGVGICDFERIKIEKIQLKMVKR